MTEVKTRAKQNDDDKMLGSLAEVKTYYFVPGLTPDIFSPDLRQRNVDNFSHILSRYLFNRLKMSLARFKLPFMNINEKINAKISHKTLKNDEFFNR